MSVLIKRVEAVLAQAKTIQRERDAFETTIRDAIKLLPKGHAARRVLLVGLLGEDLVALGDAKEP